MAVGGRVRVYRPGWVRRLWAPLRTRRLLELHSNESPVDAACRRAHAPAPCAAESLVQSSSTLPPLPARRRDGRQFRGALARCRTRRLHFHSPQRSVGIPVVSQNVHGRNS